MLPGSDGRLPQMPSNKGLESSRGLGTGGDATRGGERGMRAPLSRQQKGNSGAVSYRQAWIKGILQAPVQAIVLIGICRLLPPPLIPVPSFLTGGQVTLAKEAASMRKSTESPPRAWAPSIPCGGLD